jgi:predicted transcriptional regulator of viral defense system
VTWTKLLASKEAQRHKTSKKELDNMRALIARDLADAAIVGLSADHAGVLRPRDLDTRHIARQYLHLLHVRGLVNRVGRGLYVAAGADLTEHHSLAEASKRVPYSVVCLLSALRFHGLTTQNPFEVWIAIGPKARSPRSDSLRLRVVRFSGKALTSGIEQHSIEGVTVRVYRPAKTVADCFKYRNKIGLDVALEALRECWRERRATMDELWEHAKICRVANVMRPYLEATT